MNKVFKCLMEDFILLAVLEIKDIVNRIHTNKSILEIYFP